MEVEEIKKLLKKYARENIIFGKKKEYILERVGTTEEEIIEELQSTEDLEFVEKQLREGETRYALFFVYSKKKGRVYVITLSDKLKIITAYPLGKRTLSRYHKGRFIKSKGV